MSLFSTLSMILKWKNILLISLPEIYIYICASPWNMPPFPGLRLRRGFTRIAETFSAPSFLFSVQLRVLHPNYTVWYPSTGREPFLYDISAEARCLCPTLCWEETAIYTNLYFCFQALPCCFLTALLWPLVFFAFYCKYYASSTHRFPSS